MNTNKIHSVKYNFIMNFILTASQFIFPLITFPYVSRVLLAAGNGKITFAASVANYFMMVASLGVPTYGVRACAQVRDDKKKLSKTVREIFTINFIMTVLVCITYFICIFTVPKFQAEQGLFLINGLSIVLNMFGMNWVYQALEQYDYITFRSLFFKIVSIVLMFLLVHEQGDYIKYAAITVLAGVGSNILNFTRLHRFIEFRWEGNYNLKRHLKPILILFAQSLAVSIYTNLDTIMLGFLKTDQDVGYYNAAIKIKSILLSLVTSLGNVLLPRMSYYAKKNAMELFKSTMAKALNFTVMLSIPLSVYFVFFANESIRFLAGDGYMGAILAMQIITVAVIPNGLTGVIGVQVLTALEKEKYVLYSVIIGAIVDFTLNMVFIPDYGAAGAALATTIAEFTVLAVQLMVTKRLLLEVKKQLRGLIYLFLSIVCGTVAIIIKYIGINSIVLLLMVSTLVYFGSYFIGLLIVRDPFALELVAYAKKYLLKEE